MNKVTMVSVSTNWDGIDYIEKWCDEWVDESGDGTRVIKRSSSSSPDDKPGASSDPNVLGRALIRKGANLIRATISFGSDELLDVELAAEDGDCLEPEFVRGLFDFCVNAVLEHGGHEATNLTDKTAIRVYCRAFDLRRQKGVLRLVSGIGQDEADVEGALPDPDEWVTEEEKTDSGADSANQTGRCPPPKFGDGDGR